MEGANLSWRKSSYSSNGGDNCVEVGHGREAMLVRDTKDRDRGHLTVDADQWRKFVAGVKASTQDA